jgi:soluble lytic murein transglycosylase-like protein
VARLIVGLGLVLSVSFPRALAAESEASPAPTEVLVKTSDAEPVDAVKQISATEQIISPAPLDVPALIVEMSLRYGLEPERMLRIGWCESRWNPHAVGPGGASGVFQFMWYTWNWSSVAAGYPDASPFDPVANIEVASWLMATQGPRHWTCR